MEKKQYELCVEILRRLNKAGVLKDLILVGSWCIPFYKDYFKTIKYATSIRTRDVDFMVPGRIRIKAKVDVVELLKDLGFVVGFQGREGYIRLEHPELAIEFLVPEKGRGSNKPFPLKELGINAQPLRYLSLLTQKIIHTEIAGIKISLPHPVVFAFHKLIIATLRRNKDKAAKDIEGALRILKAVLDKGQKAVIKITFDSILPAWRKKVLKCLKKMEKEDLLRLLEE
ncbi:MAG: nucleotidyltransferase domain-containing protein [Candidatus Omnitrophica bacterium]|nr:nucleotidyltransferase domain-containing protein [Candidatus Omnitrophota bacterium]MBU0895830.1 nucleotidyltransferase domain-containing protein [Candidatus Omnitrophota bacterium]MBU1038053.1 nucleotidyltransferase domain-containing protein [Candidatus Omnitrophota bacterium]MBU1809297.1 nucleotidyltransferase domain-containing protein [Candidatus Omnitrophota bacterium]